VEPVLLIDFHCPAFYRERRWRKKITGDLQFLLQMTHSIDLYPPSAQGAPVALKALSDRWLEGMIIKPSFLSIP